ncbi:MAG: 4-diphosphocytidyl-2C-methyl-D-erythritol kinase [SAR116 cluster bacterium]|nr:MAG: 4-diphosphocytidyl-2C-methyl-D-erythritol kinase [SAR116 cluster bacterium]
MKFGPCALSDCLDAILVYAVDLPDGRIAKGTCLTSDHLSRLRANGIDDIIVARLEDGDLGEDAAADMIAKAMMPANVRLSVAATGRVNIHATKRGLLRVDRLRLRDINMVDEGITLSTVQHNQLVEAGDLIATLKIIPYSVAETAVATVIGLGAGEPVISFHALRPRSFGLIQTRIPGMADKILKATEQTAKQRLNQLGCTLVDSRVVAHEAAAIDQAITASRANGPAVMLIAGGSAIADRRDEVPMGVIAAGGRIDHFGLPVDPGNLLMLSHIDEMPVIGMPGCARSIKMNGFDWILHLLLADLRIDAAEIADMAAGGLLMEIVSRPLPRRMVGRRQISNATIGGVILAAGQSRRMGAQNKLLAEIDGVPIIRRTAQAMLDGGLNDLVIVTGHEHRLVAAALDDLPVTCIYNDEYQSGQASSVACGVRHHQNGSHAAVLIALGDMPLVRPELIAALLRDHSSLPDATDRITLPVFDGRRGNPVIWGRGFFDELVALTGDAGGRIIFAENKNAVNSLGWPDDSIHLDIDTPEALAPLKKASPKKGDK